jgi:hypothetical protein
MKTAVLVGVSVVLAAAVVALETEVLKPAQPAPGEVRAASGISAAAAYGTNVPVVAHPVSREDDQRQQLPGTSPFVKELSSLLAKTERESDPDRQEALLEDLISWIEQRDFAAAFHALNSLPPSEWLSDVQGRLLQGWSEKDPQAAANAAFATDGPAGREALESVLGVWADGHLDEAIAWVDQMPEGKARENARLHVALEAARTEPETAVALASDLPASPERDEMILHTASQWAVNDPESASAWVREFEEGSLRDSVAAMIATAWGESNPAAAAKLAMEGLPAGKAQNDVLVGIVQRWAQQDPVAVAAWVGRFPEGALRTAAMENFVKLWAQSDPLPAGNWLNTLPPGASRNNALRAYSEQRAPVSPRDAATWASAITDARMRNAQLETIAKTWLQSDRPAALAWISKAQFPQQVRNRILSE